MAFKMAGPRNVQLRGARRRKNTWYPGKYLVQGVKKIFGGNSNLSKRGTVMSTRGK